MHAAQACSHLLVGWVNRQDNGLSCKRLQKKGITMGEVATGDFTHAHMLLSAIACPDAQACVAALQPSLMDGNGCNHRQKALGLPTRNPPRALCGQRLAVPCIRVPSAPL